MKSVPNLEAQLRTRLERMRFAVLAATLWLVMGRSSIAAAQDHPAPSATES
jgi:hypothetical protein